MKASTMVNKRTTKYLYKNIRRPKNGLPRKMFAEVEEVCRECFNIKFEDGFMIVGALDEYSPFRRIRISSINGFKIVDKEVAVVTEQSILFFNNNTGAINVNLREPKVSVWQRFVNYLKSFCWHHHTKTCLE